MSSSNNDIGFAEVDEILRIIDQFPAAEIVYERGDLKLHVRRTGSVAPGHTGPLLVAATETQSAVVATAASAPVGLEAVTIAPVVQSDRSGQLAVESPMIGVFYAAPAPGAEPFVSVGQLIARGDDLCIIEVMKVMNTMTSPWSGTVMAVCAANASLVERGQPLMWIQPTGDA